MTLWKSSLKMTCFFDLICQYFWLLNIVIFGFLVKLARVAAFTCFANIFRLTKCWKMLFIYFFLLFSSLTSGDACHWKTLVKDSGQSGTFLKVKCAPDRYIRVDIILHSFQFAESIFLTGTSQESLSRPTLLWNLVRIHSYVSFIWMYIILRVFFQHFGCERNMSNTLSTSGLQFLWVAEDGPSVHICDVPYQPRCPARPSSGAAWAALCEWHNAPKPTMWHNMRHGCQLPSPTLDVYRWSCGTTRWAISWSSMSFKP